MINLGGLNAPFFMKPPQHTELLLSEKDFDGLMVPVHTTKKNIINLEPFKTSPEFHEDLGDLESNRNNVFKYIVFLYDKNSPLWNHVDDIKERKIEASLWAGFVPEDETKSFDVEVESMLRNLNPIVNHMIIRYCRIHHNRDYDLLVAGTESFYDMMLRLQTGTGPSQSEDAVFKNLEKKNKLFEHAEEQSKKLDELSNKILANDNYGGLHSELFQVIDRHRSNQLNLAPERRYQKEEE